MVKTNDATMEIIKKFIEENREALNSNDFEEIYRKIYPESSTTIGKFTETLYKVGIDPLLYLETVPNSFAATSNICSITIPNNIIIIGTIAFYSCENLENIKLSNKLKEIKSRAFKFCENLKEIKFPDSLEIIRNDAFAGCINLKTIHIGNTPQIKIEESVFSDCPNLQDVYFGCSFNSIVGNISSFGNRKFFETTWHCTDGDYRQNSKGVWGKIW